MLFGRRAVRASPGKRKSNLGDFERRIDVDFASILKAC